MLFHKKQEEAKKPVENIEPYVCKTCGCLVDRLRTHTVETLMLYNSYYTDYLYYCAVCKPPYDKIEYSMDGICYFILIPKHHEEVTEEGKPLKKKK